MIKVELLAPVEPYGSNCYLISSGNEYAIIDPSADYIKTLDTHPELKNNLKFVLITHAHFDHILTLNDWAAACDELVKL